MWTIFKSLFESVTILLCPDKSSSLIRDLTQFFAPKGEVLTTKLPGQSQDLLFKVYVIHG